MWLIRTLGGEISHHDSWTHHISIILVGYQRETGTQAAGLGLSYSNFDSGSRYIRISIGKIMLVAEVFSRNLEVNTSRYWHIQNLNADGSRSYNLTNLKMFHTGGSPPLDPQCEIMTDVSHWFRGPSIFNVHLLNWILRFHPHTAVDPFFILFVYHEAPLKSLPWTTWRISWYSQVRLLSTFVRFRSPLSDTKIGFKSWESPLRFES